MNLIKDVWTDKEEFLEYLYSLKCEEKVAWTKRIVNTNMQVLAIKIPVLRKIAKEIMKGSYYTFLDLNVNDYYECTIINAIISSNIKDFDVLKKYLNIYIKQIDNWSSVDILSFNVKNNENNFLNLSEEYLRSNRPFMRRTGIIILFKFLNNKKYLDKVFNLIKDDEDYYVNMAYAWLLCECFIKNREETLLFLDNNKINKFVLNKFVSKCRDSYRVSLDDKKMLLKYRIK